MYRNTSPDFRTLDNVNDHIAVRRGIPLKLLVGRILIPAAFIIAIGAIVLSVFTYRNIQQNAVSDVLSAVQTVYNTHPAVNGESNGLAVLSESNNFERFWILSATGDILASSRRQDVGSRLDRVWWKVLEGRTSGVVVEEVPFGSRMLLMTGVYKSEMGRWAVAVSEIPKTFATRFWTIAFILALSLMVIGSLGMITWTTLNNNVARPLLELDETTGELLRGESVSEATLDRLWAETQPSLGGHADGVVDLARRYIVNVKKGDESEERFRRLFNSLEGLAFIRSRNSRILAVNAELRSRLGLSREQILGNSVQILKKVLPIAALEEWLVKANSKNIGIRRLEVFPGEMAGVLAPIRVSSIPMRFQGVEAHLILVEQISTEGSSSSEINGRAGGALNNGVASQTGRTLDKSSTPGALHRAILQASDEMVLVLDEQTRIVYWSPAASQLTGWDPDEMDSIGTFVKKALNSGERNRFETWLDEDPTGRPLRLAINTCEGEQLSTHWKATLVKLEDGSSYGILTGRELRSSDHSGDRRDAKRKTRPSRDKKGDKTL